MDHGDPRPQRPDREAYVAPVLIVHGSVEKLTGWKGLGNSDFSFDEDSISIGS